MAPKEGLAVHFLVFRSESRELFHILNPHLCTVAPPSIGRFVEGFLFFYHPTCVPRILPTHGPRAFGKSFADGGVRGLLGRILIILLPK